jgi:hypothetical protein
MGVVDILSESKEFYLGEREYILFGILFIIFPFGVAVYQMRENWFLYILYACLFVIEFNRYGVEYKSPLNPLSLAAGFLYYQGLQLVFVYALTRYYKGKMKKRSAIIIGVISLLPGYLPVISNLFLILFLNHEIILLIPIALPALLAFLLIKFKPAKEITLWADE